MALFGSGGISGDGDSDEEWSEELDTIPLLERREMLIAARRLSGVTDIDWSGGISDTEVPDEEWSEELDTMPLLERREMLIAARRLSVVTHIESQEESQNASIPLGAVAVKKENHDSDREMNKALLPRQNYAGMLSEYNCQGTEVNEHVSSNEIEVDEISANSISVEKADACSSTLLQCSMMPKYPVKVEADFADNSSGLLGEGVGVSFHANVQAVKIKTEIADDSVDDLVLKEQQRLPLLRKSMELAEPSGEVNCLGLANPVVGMIQHHLGTYKKENDSAAVESSAAGSNSSCVPDNIISVKSEQQIAASEDKLDHMLLRDRMKMLAMKEDSVMHNSNKTESLKETVPSVLNCNPIAESTKPFRSSRPRKRRKTATESAEKALEEDAPGLLQALVEKGVSVNEIKLYGEPESHEVIDDATVQDNFSELEAVISKLSFQRQTFLKLAPLRYAKSEKASYCLACLLSLVEQARYLQFRNWPVDWGWCRDLRSFIFVFERHNRIVLERPEYGYATYFFELVDSLPIDWQIKRLVTAMKLTSCSRSTLIENKTLLIGEDLTDGEARVLMEYGWTPNSGLGTMLNYCDRVVHDHKNESDVSEWRSKIGKLLMDGYKGGTIVSTNIPKQVAEYAGAQGIKLEL